MFALPHTVHVCSAKRAFSESLTRHNHQKYCAGISLSLSPMQGTGTSIDFLSPASAVARILIGLPQIINGGRFFDKTGNRVVTGSDTGSVFNGAGVRLLYDFPADQY
eukprot:GHRR01015683.1.p2 GENE.GHRR01015683.1~~GHRR01015683.1.p2  ORF type:complete len:107 (-),score=29.14 GHRR01015683.1:1084-1404(-)